MYLFSFIEPVQCTLYIVYISMFNFWFDSYTTITITINYHIEMVQLQTLTTMQLKIEVYFFSLIRV